MRVRNIVLRIIVLLVLLIGIISYIPRLLGKDNEIRDYTFRNEELLNEHYKKHGRYMGYASKKDYEAFASNLVNYCKQNKGACEFKYEKEDNDEVYYLESANEIVFVSSDGYIRTYFRPDEGRAYFDRQ